ncbi:MAG: M14 family zinc carboxypeptidase, partial [Bacteroidia bacterium]
MKIRIFFAALLVSFLVLLSAGKPIKGKLKPSAKRKVYTVSPTYKRTMQVFDSIAKRFPKQCKAVSRNGFTDSGEEFKIYVVSKDGFVTQNANPAKRKTVLFINNAIHPGEPDGVDASIELLNTLLNDTTKIPDDLILCIVPMFNIEGAMNRGCCSRANQNGPEEYGFRGSGTNLDLNRDFVKMDSRNTQALVSFLRDYNPDVFVDTHVS